MTLITVIAGSGRTVPAAPTIGTATDTGSGRAYNNGAASVTFTAPAYDGRSAITSYTVTSSPGGFTGTGASSPVTVTGLQSSTSYTFTVTATNAIGTSSASSASNSITATTIPQVPTITSATRTGNTTVSIAFTGSTGGATLSAVTATSSPSVSISSSGTSSPMTATATYVAGTSYTFTITATNANGTSTASNTSGSVIPSPAPVLGAWSSSTIYPHTLLEASAGGPVGSLVYVGSGVSTINGFGRNVGAYWNGSSWASQIYAGSIGYVGMGRWDTNTLIGSGGIQDPDAGLYDDGTYKTTGAGWSYNGAILPNRTYAIGVGRVSDGIMYVGSNFYPQRVSYQTSLGGAMTNRGNVFPINAFQCWAGDFNLTTSYFSQMDFSTVYSATTVAGAFTAAATQPFTGGSAVNGGMFQNIQERTLFYYYGSSTVGAGVTHLFNGSTFTVSTAMPLANNNFKGGAIGSNLSAVRVPSREHYIATLS